MTIDISTWQILVLNLPNFAGLLIALFVLERRLVSLETLLRDVLVRCLPDPDG